MKRIRLRNPAEFASEKECFIVRMHAPLRNSTEQRIHTVFFHHCAILRNHAECEFMKEILHCRASFLITLCRGFLAGMHIVGELRNYTE